MRTTIDLDDALLRRLRDVAHREGLSFRALLHRVIQRGLEDSAAPADVPYETPSLSMGRVREGVDFTKALRLAAALEDEEIVRELAQRR